MKTSLTIRNIIGAFVGGMSGILACYYAGLAYMPFACLVGVVLGFWHDRLIRDYKQYIATARNILAKGYARLVAWKNSFVSYMKQPKESMQKRSVGVSEELEIERCLKRFFFWLISQPLIFVAWLRKHPMNRADTLTCLVGVGVIIALKQFGYFTIFFGPPGHSLMAQGSSFPEQFVGVGMFISTFMLLVFPVLAIGMRPEDMKGFYHQYSRYSRYGAFGWTLFQLKNAVMLYTYAFILSELGIAAIFLLIGVIMFTIAVICFVVIPARLFWNCVKLPGHWFCFGATLLTTFVAWLVVRNHVNSSAVAWMLALANGVLSAVATEGLRRFYYYIVHKSEWLYELTHMKILDDGDPGDIFAFLWNTLALPPLSVVARAWCRWIWPHVRRIRFNPEGFLSPI